MPNDSPPPSSPMSTNPVAAVPRPASEESVRREKTFAAEANVTYVRLAIIVFNTLAYLFLLDHEDTIPWLVYGIICVANPYAFYVWWFQPYRRYPVLLSSYFTSISDSVLIALWVLGTGAV